MDKERRLLDRIGGDKVVWLILLLLMMISLVGLSSATSSMANDKISRFDIILDQLKTIGMGIAAIVFCVFVMNIKGFRKLSSLGFLGCMAALIFLDLHLAPSEKFCAAPINNAWRIIKVGSIQIHVLEIVKVAMVMYLAWAVDKYKNGRFRLQEMLATLPHLGWLGTPMAKKIVNIYGPMVIVCGLALPAGTSNAVFIGGILFLTLVIAGMPFKDMSGMLLIGITVAGLIVGIHKATDGKFIPRLSTALSDSRDMSAQIDSLKSSTPGSGKYLEALDLLRQPYGAKMAIANGGLSGKGPGKSTMKYVVPIIYEDYMFSFLVEEYGILIGGIIIFALYIAMLARGAIIARNCDDLFSKVTVGGLSALIAGQATMHIMVNCDVGIQTGQTLPLISYGTSAFICFSIAFGVILSISRSAQAKVQKEMERSESLMTATGEEIVSEPDNIIQL